MFPYTVSYPFTYTWIPNHFISEVNLPCLPIYQTPIQIVITQGFNEKLTTINYKQLDKKESYFVESKPQKLCEQVSQKRSQNKYRNILTNITSLMLNFIISPKKSNQLLFRIKPDLTEEDEIMFYQYIKNLKKYFCSYFNPQKLKLLFQGKSISSYNPQLHRLFRLMIKIILQERIHLCLMTSKKISKQLRKEHICGRRIILNILKYGSTLTEKKYSTSV